jgi:hypothetical protein
MCAPRKKLIIELDGRKEEATRITDVIRDHQTWLTQYGRRLRRDAARRQSCPISIVFANLECYNLFSPGIHSTAKNNLRDQPSWLKNILALALLSRARRNHVSTARGTEG